MSGIGFPTVILIMLRKLRPPSVNKYPYLDLCICICRSELEILRKDLESMTCESWKNEENIDEITQKIQEEEQKQKSAVEERDAQKIEVQWGSE